MDRAVALILMVSTLTVLVSSHQVCFIGSEFNQGSGLPPRWFLPYNDRCKCAAVRLGGVGIPSWYRMREPYILSEIFLSEDPNEIQALFGCIHSDSNEVGTTVTKDAFEETAGGGPRQAEPNLPL
ncbi:uncharacterized protein LOC110985621 [Acanthaster planci]|uniref:Uncharacterized protein LOC110985621 n=1 Tax=Acanthaster planci TaxID=133434 RepID=A0A8B7Z9V9_ACAPL|nr:uncharacterized protein LOC110985621 [Acanthaster planci]